MGFCAAFGCNNRSTRSKKTSVSFFRFPREKPYRQAWINYTRRKFKLSDHHKLCSDHFSSNCFVRDPRSLVSLGMSSPYNRPVLKTDAVPDIPLPIQNGATPAEADSSLELRLPSRHQRLQKRYRAQVLSRAMEEFSTQSEPDLEETSDREEIPMEVTPAITPKQSTQETQTFTSTSNKKVQVKLLPPQRTRCHQTDTQTSPIFRTFGTQTDPKITMLHVSSAAVGHPEASSDPESEDEDGDIDQYSDHSDYDPFDDLECSDDEDGEGEVCVTNYTLERDMSPEEEKQFLVGESALAELLSVCRYCSGQCTPLVQFTRGTMIVTNSVCVNGHSSVWKSQPCHKTLPWSNLLTASAIITSGSNASKALQLFDNMNLQMFSARTYSRLQSLYVVPSIQWTWDIQQAELLAQVRGKEVVLGGDARCDSPGYSAKYGSYTLIDLEANKVLDTNLVQCNEVQGSSHMELEGLKRGLDFLSRNVEVKALVTDRHSMVKKYMREEHSDKQHYFDVWHVAKGISKKLEATAKKKNGQEIRPWIKAIVNHLHWVSASCGGDGDLVTAKWLSLVNHISNKHEGHSDIYPACEHGEMTEDRAWLREGSVPYKLIKEVIANKFLMKDVPRLSPVHQTYSLEVFHSIVNHYAPKSTHFQYASMAARNCVAVLHYNENSNRPQATSQDGKLKYTTCYPKGKKGAVAVVKPCKPPPTFGYVALIKQAIVERRSHECLTYADATEDIRILNRDNPPTVTSTFQSYSKSDLIRQHRSRFNRH